MFCNCTRASAGQKNTQYFMIERIIFPLTLSLGCRYAPDGLPAEEHPSNNRRRCHRLQMVFITQEHCSGCHSGQSWSRVGSHGMSENAALYVQTHNNHAVVLYLCIWLVCLVIWSLQKCTVYILPVSSNSLTHLTSRQKNPVYSISSVIKWVEPSKYKP